MRLYHYTCSHGAEGIRKDLCLKGNPHPLMPESYGPLIWLTDLDSPDRQALGLTSRLLRCDRTTHRVTVDTELALHWPEFARTLSRRLRDLLEQDAKPIHWYVGGPHRIAAIRVEGL